MARFHHRIRWKPTNRPKTDAWQRGRPALVGLTVSLIVVGAGLGGALASTWDRGAAPSGEAPRLLPWSADLDAAREETAGTDGWTPDEARTGGADAAPTSPSVPDAETAASAAGMDAGTGDPGSEVEADAGTPAPPVSGGRAWAVRVGVFSVEENARARLEEVDTTGFGVVRTGTSVRRPHFVYTGRFETRDAADEAAEQARAAGLDAVVVTFTPPAEGVR